MVKARLIGDGNAGRAGSGRAFPSTATSTVAIWKWTLDVDTRHSNVRTLTGSRSVRTRGTGRQILSASVSGRPPGYAGVGASVMSPCQEGESPSYVKSYHM